MAKLMHGAAASVHALRRKSTPNYAGLLIQHWMSILGCWQDPQRSLRKAQQVSQWAASALGFALVGEMSLSRVIARITGAMSKGCRIDSRRKKHNTYQLVRDPTLIHS